MIGVPGEDAEKVFRLSRGFQIEVVPADNAFALFVVAADPTPAWLAIPGLLVVSALLLAYAAMQARKMEVSYSD